MDLATQELMNLFRDKKVINIRDYLSPELVCFLDEQTRDEALRSLVGQLVLSGRFQDGERFYQAVLEREGIVSTGLGLSVAIPHAKLEECSDFFIVIGIQSGKGIEWNALDGNPVRLIFMIGGPEGRQTEYLKILSHLTTAIKEDSRRSSLIQAKSVEEVLALFENC